MALSLSSSQLLIGTKAGDIHIHALPSHQHLRTISAHAQTGAISHISTMLCPPDLVGRPFRADEWAVMEIRNLERMRVGRAAKDAQEVVVVLPGASGNFAAVDALRGHGAELQVQLGGRGRVERQEEEDTAALQAEVKRLRAALGRAVKLNEKMWNGVVDLKLGS